MRPVVVALVACTSLAWSAPAVAQTPPMGADAHDAYARGTSAFRRGDYATAAREYAAADALAPNPVALQAALDATVLADDPVFGTALLDRARGEARTDALLTTMLTAEKKFAHRVGRIRLDCPSAPCLGAIDGAAAVTGQPVVVRVGSHAVTLEASGTVVQRVVTVAPDDTVVVATPTPTPIPIPIPTSTSTSTPTPTSTPPLTRTAHGLLSPVFFYAGLGATAVAGAFALGFGVDTASRHSAFGECTTSCSSLASQGRDAQLRTNVLLGVTAGLGVATLVTALRVRWHDASVSAGLGRVSFDARF